MRQKIYNFIVQYITEHGYAPTYKEICDGVEEQSAWIVHRHMQELFRDGVLETDHRGFPRAIRVKGYEFVKKEQENESFT